MNDHKGAMPLRRPMPSLVLFAAAGPLTVEVEESCARLGRPIAALLLNRPGPNVVLDPTLLAPAEPLPAQAEGADFICALFTPANRRLAVAEAVALGLHPAAALVDPTAIVAKSARLAEGCYINAGAIIGALTVLGRFVTVNRGASVGHHAEIGEFASIGPGVVIAGMTRIGAGTLVGAGAVLAPNVTLGEGCVVAPGAVITRDIPDGARAMGNPMRLFR